MPRSTKDSNTKKEPSRTVTRASVGPDVAEQQNIEATANRGRGDEARSRRIPATEPAQAGWRHGSSRAAVTPPTACQDSAHVRRTTPRLTSLAHSSQYCSHRPHPHGVGQTHRRITTQGFSTCCDLFNTKSTYPLIRLKQHQVFSVGSARMLQSARLARCWMLPNWPVLASLLLAVTFEGELTGRK